MNEKQEKALEKAKALLQILEEANLPKQMKINAYMTLTDVQLYIEAHRVALLHLPVLSYEWKLHYLRVYDLKQHIQNEKTETS